MALTDYQKQEAANPEWAKATKVHDWRNHVPEEVQELWSTFTTVQQHALFTWADELASREHWD